MSVKAMERAKKNQNRNDCNFWGGLSVFKSEVEARDFFNNHIKGIPHFRQTHIAELALIPADGWESEAKSNGHFTLHESDVAVIYTAVQNIAII